MRVRTIIIVAMIFVLSAVSFAAAADKKPKDEVRKASVQFYAALNSMINGNAGPLADIWSHSATVTTMHPIGGREIGWEAVKTSFEQVAKLASDGKAVLKDQLIRVNGNMAYEMGIESGQFEACRTSGQHRESRHEHLSARRQSMENCPSPRR